MDERLSQIDSTIPSDKEFLINESTEDSASVDLTVGLNLPVHNDDPNYFIHAQKSSFPYNHLIVTISTIIVATVTVVVFPPYLDSLNKKSDVYCGLLFTSFCIWIFFSLLLMICKIYTRDWSIRPPLPFCKMLKIGVYLGISGLCIFYARDRSRVLCHLQDPLAAALLPMAVVGHFLFSSKVDSTRKLFCLAAVIIGLFICIDFQIWDEFTCHGHPNTDMSQDEKRWTSDENIIWTLVYLMGLVLFALFLTLLEKEMKGDQPQCLVATIALTPTNPVSTNTDGAQDDMNETLIHSPEAATHCTKMIPYISRDYSVELFYKSQVLVLVVWIQVYAFVTMLAFGWTNLFYFLGKAGSGEVFDQNLKNAIYCYFHYSDECGNLMVVGWIFTIFSAALLLSIVFFVNYSSTCSAPYLAAIITTALPLSAFCWSFFKTENGFQWDPSFTGETGFTVVGLPIMAVALGFYRYYAYKENRCKM